MIVHTWLCSPRLLPARYRCRQTPVPASTAGEPGGTFPRRPHGTIIKVFPQVNSWPGIPADLINPPVYNPGPLNYPALNYPFLNQTQIVPYNPFAVSPLANPFGPPLGFGTFTSITPAVAIQQPNQLLCAARTCR